jgi:hypothetical protein
MQIVDHQRNATAGGLRVGRAKDERLDIDTTLMDRERANRPLRAFAGKLSGSLPINSHI